MHRKIRLVEITNGQQGWKGTWYRTGQRHFVYQDPLWPQVSLQRWRAFDEIGGIAEGDCRALRGPLIWLRCLLKSLGQPLP